MKAIHWILAVAASAALPSWAQERVPSRGALLYNNHCIACHSTQMHWRAQRLARDWGTLRAQVVRWKDNTGLSWSEADVDDVTRHLNDTIYRYPQPEQVGRRQGEAAQSPHGPERASPAAPRHPRDAFRQAQGDAHRRPAG